MDHGVEAVAKKKEEGSKVAWPGSCLLVGVQWQLAGLCSGGSKWQKEEGKARRWANGGRWQQL